MVFMVLFCIEKTLYPPNGLIVKDLISDFHPDLNAKYAQILAQLLSLPTYAYFCECVSLHAHANFQFLKILHNNSSA